MPRSSAAGISSGTSVVCWLGVGGGSVDARKMGVGLLGATLIFAAGCSGSSEPVAMELQEATSPSAAAGADRTESAIRTETGSPAAQAQAQDEGDGDYSAISGTWTGDLTWKPDVMHASGSPSHAELQLGQAAEPRSPVGKLVERQERDSEMVCTWTVIAMTASAPTYEVAAREGSGEAGCTNGSLRLEWDEENDVLLVDGRWPGGSWDGELTRDAGA